VRSFRGDGIAARLGGFRLPMIGGALEHFRNYGEVSSEGHVGLFLRKGQSSL